MHQAPLIIDAALMVLAVEYHGFKYWTMGARCEPGPYGNWPEDEININRKPLL
ncbi:MAG TPA: hypothetical protein VH682_31780 [Gemmataceae bacterium]